MSQEDLLAWMSQEYFGNTVQSYLIALGIFIGLLLIFHLLSHYAAKRLQRWADRTETRVDDEMLLMLHKMPHVLRWVLALYLALFFIEIPELAERGVRLTLIVLLFFWATRTVSILVEMALNLARKEPATEPLEKKNAYFALKLIAQVALWSVALLMILSNLGINISALVASLGIGGIAVALAAQNILGDMISSISIYMDRPFEVGDFIIVGDVMGTVQKVGLKTTRVKALQGEEIIIANQELVNVRIHNYKRMERRRILFGFGVTYSTPHQKLARIPSMVESIVQQIELTEFDRAHFKAFGDSSLDFEVVYYINTSEYKKYMDIQQQINLAIVREFEKESIQIAFPTRTVHLAK